MKEQRLFTRILFPAVFILLLPVLSCLVFRFAAERYACERAAGQLADLQKNIIPLMDSAFQKQGNTSPQEQVRDFLRQAGAAARRMGGDGELLILASEYQVIYPREEEEREAGASVAAACIEHIRTSEEGLGRKAVRLTTADKESFLANFYRVPSRSRQIEYLITYCSVSAITGWVDGAARLVLVISSVFSLGALSALWFAARSISRPLSRLCREAERIGKGSFDPIQPAFSIRELEGLRRSMNRMSDQLRRSDEAQRSFFQNVSHDLRTPLMSISGYAQGIETGVFGDPVPAARTILEESSRLTGLVSGLLTLSRLESAPEPPALAPVAIVDSLEDRMERMEGFAMEKGIALSLDAPGKSPLVLGEEELLDKVLDNLLSNAIRYAKSQVTAEVRTQGDHILVSVLDDGPGIAPEDLPHLFERCYKGKGGNFGIGLSIAQAAARAIGGELKAENRSSGGAAFTLILKNA